MNKMKLLVVCGGQSTEHSVSRMSCTSVCKHLNEDKYGYQVHLKFMIF